MFPQYKRGSHAGCLKGESPEANCSGNAVFTLFLLRTPANVVVKQSGFNNREGKGADHSAGSESLAMCYWYFLLEGGVFFERGLSEPLEEPEMGVRLEKTGS